MRYQDNSQPQFNSTDDSSTTKSFRFKRPNYTQTPNDYYDHVMPSLKTVGEHAVMQVIIRQTIGWGNKEWDRISLSQLTKKTGLSRPTIRKAIRILCDKGLIIMHAQGRNGEQQTFFKLNIEDSDFVSENDGFSNKLDRESFDTGGGKDSFPTKETTTKETKNKVVGNIDKPKTKIADPPPSFQKMSEQEESKLIEMAGKKLAKKYSGNAAKTLTSERFKNSPLRGMSHYELAVKYFRDDAVNREKEKSIETREERDNKAWIEAIAKKNKIVERDILISKSYCVLFPTVCGEGPQFYYIDQDFKKLVRDRYALSNKNLKEIENE